MCDKVENEKKDREWGKIIIGKIDIMLREVNEEQKKEAGGEETRVKKSERRRRNWRE